MATISQINSTIVAAYERLEATLSSANAAYELALVGAREKFRQTYKKAAIDLFGHDPTDLEIQKKLEEMENRDPEFINHQKRIQEDQRKLAEERNKIANSLKEAISWLDQHTGQ